MKCLKYIIIVLLTLPLYGASYTHDDFHQDITQIQNEIHTTSNKLVELETKVDRYDTFSKNFKDKDYTLSKIIEYISYGAYIVTGIIILFIIWLCNFIGRSVTKLEENYKPKYQESVDRYENKIIAIEEDTERKISAIQDKADRIVSQILSTSSSSIIITETQTNTNNPF